MRPQFEVMLPVEQQQLLARVRDGLHCSEPRVHAQMAHNTLELLVDETDRHYWSPWLSVIIDEHEDGSRVRGRFGPHPAVWTMFMSMHIFLVLSAMSGGILGFTHWLLGHTPWALIAVPICGVLMLGVYLASLIGQGAGADQMHVLRAALDCMLGEKTHEPWRPPDDAQG